MAHKDPHSLSFNLSSSIGSTIRIPILFPNDYEVWALHFEDYVLGLEDYGSTIWHAITQETYKHMDTKMQIKTLVEHTVPQDEKDKLMSNIKAMRIIRIALPQDIFCLVSACETAKAIWDRLKELYSSDADLEHSVQTMLLSEFGAFVQKYEEKLDQTFNRFNHLLSRMVKNNLKHEIIEQKVTFMNGLRSEWKAFVSTVKAHEEFKSYTLAKLVGILRSHEEEVTKEMKVVSSMGSLALVAKGKKTAEEDSESDLSESEISKEDKALLVSNPKNFYKKNFLATEISTCKLDCEIGKGLYKIILAFIELKEDEIDADCYNCESIVSLDDIYNSYWAGLVKIEKYVQSKDHKNMLKKMLNEKDKEQIILSTMQKYDSLCKKLNLENTFDSKNVSGIDKSDMSEIFVEDGIDFSTFVQNANKPKKNLISENSIEFLNCSKQRFKCFERKSNCFFESPNCSESSFC
ncbi:uncharacterized protein LOC128133449 [Lactuca sativa]|uniref:uncharacterized protein LOC128133449 n=1 Tax=Lactuca sativa TaxID=4236 RepID=UPI0022B0218D|nr:uncharacterized protein LOC128133449 [Lactuca sativa]